MATPEKLDDSSPRERAIVDHALGVARRAIDEVVDYLRTADVTLMEAVDATRLLAMRRDVDEQPDVISLRQTATQLLFASGFTVHGDDPDDGSEGC